MTKTQKKRAWEKIYTEATEDFNAYGFCYGLCCYVPKDEGYYQRNQELMDDLKIFEPEKYDCKYGIFWWDINDDHARLIALALLISINS